jgi:2-succinyl-6-hydroxy-2,4-cyclohexadiene-1-carboxylate synthase
VAHYQSNYLTLRDGYKLHCRVWGDGEPLVMLHGFMGASTSWGDQLLTVLADDYRVIALELLGHGQSDKPAQPERYAMHEIVQDICDVLDGLSITAPHLLGYSMGGRVALAFAALQPARVNHLILESASPGLNTAQERKARRCADERLAQQLETHGITPFVDTWEKLPLFESQQRLAKPLQNTVRQTRLRNDPAALAASLRGLGTGSQPSFWKVLPDLSQPALLLCGSLDSKFVAINRQMMMHLPNVCLAIIEDAGHTVHLEQPIAWLRKVRQSLSGA